MTADDDNQWSSPFYVTNWPLILIITLIGVTAILLVWAWAYFPDFSVPEGSFGIGFQVDLDLLAALGGALGIGAVIRHRTPKLQTAEATFQISEFGRSPLSMLKTPLDLKALNESGVPVPKDVRLEDEDGSPVSATEGTVGIKHTKTRQVPVYYVKLGGWKIEGFFLRPKDFWLIFFGNQICQMGDAKSGTSYFCPRLIRALHPDQIPSQWLEGLRKSADFKPGKSTVLITGEISPSFIEWMGWNSEEILPYLQGLPPNRFFGPADGEYFRDRWLDAVAQLHYTRSERDSLRDSLNNLRDAERADSRRRKRVYDSSGDEEPNIERMRGAPARYERL